MGWTSVVFHRLMSPLNAVGRLENALSMLVMSDTSQSGMEPYSAYRAGMLAPVMLGHIPSRAS